MATDQLSDQEIQFKKRARRRLVGAIALVLLMITVLPMVLDDRAVKTPQQEIAITIPSQDSGDFTSKIVPVDSNPASSKQPEANTKPEPAVPLAQPLEKSQVPRVQSSKTLAVKPVSESHTAAVEPRPGASEPKKEIRIKATEAEKSMVKAGSFSVQIGVFSDAANVKKMQQKLQDQGYKSYTEKLSTPNGEKIRLRAGPFASKSDAQDALSKIKDAGLSGMLVSNK